MTSNYRHILQQAEILEQSTKFIEKSYVVYKTEEERLADLDAITKLLQETLKVIENLKLK